MRTIKQSDKISTGLPKFWIRSQDLVPIFTRAESVDRPIKAEIEKSSNEFILLEGSKDFIENAHLFSQKFSVEIGSIRIKNTRHAKEIEFKEEDKALAHSITIELKTYEPWWQVFHKSKVFWSLMGFFWIFLAVPLENKNIYEVASAITVGLLLGAIFAFILDAYVFIPKVFSKKYDNIWSRNKDKIVWALLGATGSHLLTNHEEILEYFRSLTSKAL